MTQNPPRILRAADLVEGADYISPSGRRCRLLPAGASGLGLSCYLFAYVTRTGKPSADDGFALNAHNAQAIAALRPVR